MARFFLGRRQPFFLHLMIFLRRGLFTPLIVSAPVSGEIKKRVSLRRTFYAPFASPPILIFFSHLFFVTPQPRLEISSSVIYATEFCSRITSFLLVFKPYPCSFCPWWRCFFALSDAKDLTLSLPNFVMVFPFSPIVPFFWKLFASFQFPIVSFPPEQDPTRCLSNNRIGPIFSPPGWGVAFSGGLWCGGGFPRKGDSLVHKPVCLFFI